MIDPDSDAPSVADRVSAIEDLPLAERAPAYAELHAALSAQLETADGAQPRR